MSKKEPPEVCIVRPHSDPEKRAAGGCAPCLMMTSLYLAVPTAVVGLIVKWGRR